MRYLSVYLDEVSHFGNSVQDPEVKEDDFCLLVFFQKHGNQNSVEQKWFGMKCPSNVCLA